MRPLFCLSFSPVDVRFRRRQIQIMVNDRVDIIKTWVIVCGLECQDQLIARENAGTLICYQALYGHASIGKVVPQTKVFPKVLFSCARVEHHEVGVHFANSLQSNWILIPMRLAAVKEIVGDDGLFLGVHAHPVTVVVLGVVIWIERLVLPFYGEPLLHELVVRQHDRVDECLTSWMQRWINVLGNYRWIILHKAL